MPADATRARPARGRVLSALARLADSGLDNDSFRHEAAAILRHAVGFDWWCWPLTDPGARLPTRFAGVESAIDHNYLRFCRLVIGPGTWDAPAVPDRPGGRPAPAAAAISTSTGGDLPRDLLWREILGPAGTGDVLSVMLAAGGVCWGQLHLGRDRPGRWFTEDDERLLAEAAPLIGGRLRDGLRARRNPGGHEPEPGTIIVDRDLSLVAATGEAWRWIGRLGIPQVSGTEPLPGFIYCVATRAAVCTARPPRPARVRLQDATGRWVVARAAPLTHAAAPPGGAGGGTGYAITLERARSEDLAPLLMRAWALTSREREVARLVIDGLSTDDIAAALFLSAHTVRDYLKAIFAKVGVSRRSDLVSALAGQLPGPG